MIIFFWRCHSFGLVMAQITLCGVNRDIAFNRCKEEKEEDAQHDDAVAAIQQQGNAAVIGQEIVINRPRN